MDSATKFFLGSNTNEGFYSCFDQLYDPEEDWKAYIIKGGAGCGKSTLMRKLAGQLEDSGEKCLHVMCASDPHSYDAVICENLKTVMVDGTAPHVIEPRYYGAVEEIVNMGEALDSDEMRKDAGKVRELFEENAHCYRKATNYLKAAASLMRNSKKLQDEYINYEKLYNYVIRFAKRYFVEGEEPGKIHYRFYSAITPEGEITFGQSITEEYPQIISIEDPIGAVSGQILDCLLTFALDCGINAIAGISPYDTEELEQLLFPDYGIAIVHQNENIPATRTIHASRFLNSDGLKLHKYRLAFNRKTSAQLRKAAIDCLKEAKKIHDAIESLYKKNINYEKMDDIGNKLLKRLADS